jgi:hypothetical protein
VQLIKVSKNLYQFLAAPGCIKGYGSIEGIEGKIFLGWRDRLFMDIDFSDALELMLKEAFERLEMEKIFIYDPVGGYVEYEKKKWLKQQKDRERETKKKYKELLRAIRCSPKE